MGQMRATGEIEVQGGASGTGGPPGSPAGLLDLVTLGLVIVLLVLVAFSFIVTPIPVVIPIVETLVAVSVGGLVIGLRALRQRDVKQALQRAQQLAQELQGIQDQAFTDSLTGLWNSRYLQEQLPNELSRVRRRNLQLSLLMVDVDGLKTINDRFGHATGNVLLRDIGGLLKESLRVSDIAGRWGGDEFLLILPEAGKADSLAVAKRLRFRLDQYRLRVGGQAIPVGTSVGIAAYPVDGEEAGVLFERADAAMYLAKKRGGNQVSVYAGPVGGQRKRVGEYLMELGVCTVEQMEEALRYSLESSKQGVDLTIGEALAKLGYATVQEVEQALSLQARDRQRASAPVEPERP